MKDHKPQPLPSPNSKMGLRNRIVKAFLPPPTQGRGGNLFPDVIVTSHTGKAYRFYSDLIRNKVVLVHFMSLDNQQYFSSLGFLSQLIPHLGGHLGNQLSLYSITTDPERDTPERLAAYVKEQAIPSGWHLLHTSEEGLKAISTRFARHLPQYRSKDGIDARMVHCGNGRVGLWSAFAADADPANSARRVCGLFSGNSTNGNAGQTSPTLTTYRQLETSNIREI